MSTDLEQLLSTPVEQLARESHGHPLDVVVIGAGVTGCAAARALGEADLRVAILEAGPFVLPGHAWATDLRFSPGAIRELQTRLSYSPPARSGGPFGSLIACVGGRGMFWNGAAPRFLDADFRDWPIGPTDLSAAYAWAERELGVTTAWGETRLAKYIQDQLTRVGIRPEAEPFAIDPRPSLEGHLGGVIGNPVSLLLRSGLLKPAAVGGRVTLTAGAFVDHIDLSATAAVDVHVSADGDHSVLARHVVLASGGFESVRLALSSAIPDRSGSLARNIIDHWFVRGYFPAPPGTYSDTAPEAGAVLVRPGSEDRFQVEVHAPGRRFFMARSVDDWRPDESDAYSVMVRAFAPTTSADGEIRLTESSDPGGYEVHIPATDEDGTLLDEMVHGVERIRQVLNCSSADVDQYPLGASYHEAGGLRMAKGASAGVVNGDGRCFADPRITVVDASAWPSIGCANPHLTLVAVARRQGLILAKELAA